MKRCPNCNEHKQLSDFHKNRARYDGVQTYCRECKVAYDNTYYKKNKRTHYERVQRYLIRNRQLLWNYLLEHPCIDCGENDPKVLDFDHIKKKDHTIAWMMSNKRSWSNIKAEIDKCEIRCANCHRRKTANQLGWYANII